MSEKQAEQLPALPDKAVVHTVMPDDYRYGPVFAYTATQMRIYARTAIEEARPPAPDVSALVDTLREIVGEVYCQGPNCLYCDRDEKHPPTWSATTARKALAIYDKQAAPVEGTSEEWTFVRDDRMGREVRCVACGNHAYFLYPSSLSPCKRCDSRRQPAERGE